MPSRHPAYRWIALLAMLIAMVRVVGYWRVYNDTFDETANIGTASALYTTGRHVLDVQHPPVAKWAIGLPLALSGIEWIRPPAGTTVDVAGAAWAIGYDLLYSPTSDYWRVLTLARLGAAIFLPITLVFVYLLGRRLFDERVGLLATVLLSTDPTFLAHVGLATSDGAAVAGSAVAGYFAFRWIGRPTWKRTFALAAAAAVTLAAKFSILVILAGLFCAWLWRSIYLFCAASPAQIRRTLPPWHAVWKVLAIIPLALLVMWAIYGFAIGPIGDTRQFVDRPQWQRIPEAVKRLPVPMPSLALGFMQLAGHTMTGHPSYFNGKLLLHGDAWYFPTAFLLKTPICTLLLLLLAIGGVAWNKSQWGRIFLLLIPVVLYAIVSFRSSITIGIRHLLPILPLLYVAAIAALTGGRPNRFRLVRQAMCLILIAGVVVETAARHPDYLPFFNRLIPPDADRKYLVDSNLDWGQDIYRLQQWQRQNASVPLTADLFHPCPDRLAQRLGLTSFNGRFEPGTWFAVSASAEAGLNGVIFYGDGAGIPGVDYAFLARYPKIATIGRSITVYDLRGMPGKDRALLRRRADPTP